MEFVSMREFTASPKETQKKLSVGGELVVTNNGRPTMLVIDITNRDFLRVIDHLRRQEALDILSQIQMDSVRNGADALSMEEIDAEIAAYRQEKRGE
ncbi:MAG: hypothetical protein LBU58_04200 [Clostridiales bacterium]|jgi:hypothetical protein|nr:hypothetical protein [Clostridiales bacterium]